MRKGWLEWRKEGNRSRVEIGPMPVYVCEWIVHVFVCEMKAPFCVVRSQREN